MVLPREVLITGVGVASPIGMSCQEFWTSLCEGRSGVRSVDWLADTPWPVPFGAPLANFEPKLYVKPRKTLKVMSREIQIGFAAAALASEDAGLEAESIDSDRFGVVFGSQMIYFEPEELAAVYRGCITDGQFDIHSWGQLAMSEIFPLWLLKSLPNMTACHIGIAHDARGPCNSIVSGDASGLRAIAEAAHIIGRGHADVMIAGGAASRLAVTPLLYRGDAILSHRSDDPAAASRPFDADRDGMVNGEGGAAFILESRDHATKRGANVRAQIVGWGEGYECRWKGPEPTGNGYRMAIQQALRKTGVQPDQLDHVNAHGLSSVQDDPLEAQAIRDYLGDTPVTAPKSYFGNLGAGSAVVEMAASVLALEQRQVPVTLNHETPDPACPVNVIRREPKPVTQSTVMNLSQSGTGQTVALIISDV